MGKAGKVMGIIDKRILKDGSPRYDARIHRRNAKGAKNGWQSKTFKTEKEAKAWINATEAKIDKGGSISKKADQLTFHDVANAYMLRATPTDKQKVGMRERILARQEKGESVEMPIKFGIHADEERVVKMCMEHWGSMIKISEITNSKVKGWLELFAATEIKEPASRKKKHPYFKGGLKPNGEKRTYSASTIRRHYFIFKKILEKGQIHHGYHLDPLVFEEVAAPEAWKGQRKRRLEPGEEEKLFAAIDSGRAHKEAWKALITFALDTTARMQEILLADWPEIHEARRLWSIPAEHTKTNEARTVPLTLASLDAIKTMRGLRDPKSTKIFHQWQNGGGLSKAWKRLTTRAGIDGLTFHDLRHEATSRLFEFTDLKDVEIMKITGHTSHEMIKGYLGLRESSVAARMDATRRPPQPQPGPTSES